MKRLSALILCIIVVFGALFPALSEEEFTLRNGIVFGDTIDDIFEKETTLQHCDTTFGNMSNISDALMNILIKDICLSYSSVYSHDYSHDYFSGKIAGYSDTYCLFYFDDAEKLKSMEYDFRSSCTSKDAMNIIYETMYSSLIRQYGKPLGNTGGSCHLITGPAIIDMGFYVYQEGQSNGNGGDYTDYDEWIVNCDGYNVKIDLTSYWWRDDDYNYSYNVNLSYYYFTDSELEEEVDAKQAEQDEVDNDL